MSIPGRFQHIKPNTSIRLAHKSVPFLLLGHQRAPQAVSPKPAKRWSCRS